MVTTGTAARHPRRRARRGEGGALREEILAAAKQLLAETGSEDAVSVRAVADRVGVTTPALYLHFADKSALIEAVCEDVFSHLDRAMEEAAAADSRPMESLRERGLAYVRFAVANPEHYRIVMMSRVHGGGGGRFDGESMEETSAFVHLVDAVRRCQDAGVLGTHVPRERIALLLWSAAHGIASLMVSKPDFDWGPVEGIAGEAIAMAGCGLAVLHRMPEGMDVGDIGRILDAAVGPAAADAAPADGEAPGDSGGRR
jgi:AcrR family transcriptional regulator